MAWILKNWKTSLAGLSGVLLGLGLFGAAIKQALDGAFSFEAFSVAIAAISAGIAGLMAKDGNNSNAPTPTKLLTVPKGT